VVFVNAKPYTTKEHLCLVVWIQHASIGTLFRKHSRLFTFFSFFSIQNVFTFEFKDKCLCVAYTSATVAYTSDMCDVSVGKG